MTVGVSIIGCGLIGAKRALSLPPDASVVAVYDLVPARAQALADRCGGPAVIAASLDEVLSVPADLAIVATLHRDLALVAAAAVDQGLHVLIEKPGARRPGELRDVRTEAEKLGRSVRVGFNHRFHPGVQKARALLRDHDYGPLLYVRARYGHGGRVGYDKEWRADRELSGGGELLDQGVHLIDLVRYLEGEVELTFAELTSAFWDMPVEDNAFLCLGVREGGVAWLHASWTEWKNLFSFEIAHRTAKLELTGLGGSYGTERLTLYEMQPEMGPPDTTSWEWPGGDDSWSLETKDVLGTLAGAPGDGASIDDAIATLEIVAAAYGA